MWKIREFSRSFRSNFHGLLKDSYKVLWNNTKPRWVHDWSGRPHTIGRRSTVLSSLRCWCFRASRYTKKRKKYECYIFSFRLLGSLGGCLSTQSSLILRKRGTKCCMSCHNIFIFKYIVSSTTITKKWFISSWRAMYDNVVQYNFYDVTKLLLRGGAFSLWSTYILIMLVPLVLI